MSLLQTDHRRPSATPAPAPPPVVEAIGLSRSFGDNRALDDVSLAVHSGEIHALLGPNGAGKSTFLRILSRLVGPDAGEILIRGVPTDRISTRAYKGLVGLIPSGDRTFYLRLSGLENLLFFGRLHGLSRRTARERALEHIADVGLADAARRPVGTYSHGMQKRLAVARALLSQPPIIFVDEATHDLDPGGAARVQELIAATAARGAAVIWTTQRIEEIRAFADAVTLLDGGSVRFAGTVPQLMATWQSTTYVIHVAAGPEVDLLDAARSAVGARAHLSPADDRDPRHFVLALAEGEILGRALAALTGAGIDVLSCTEETSSLQGAFLRLVERHDR
jgi:ABC-type multidrug transport system ATPase subunit